MVPKPHFWQPKHNFLMWLENENTEGKVNPTDPIALPILGSNCCIRLQALVDPIMELAVGLREHLFYKTDNFTRKRQICFKKEIKNKPMRFLPTVMLFHLRMVSLTSVKIISVYLNWLYIGEENHFCCSLCRRSCESERPGSSLRATLCFKMQFNPREVLQNNKLPKYPVVLKVCI